MIQENTDIKVGDYLKSYGELREVLAITLIQDPNPVCVAIAYDGRIRVMLYYRNYENFYRKEDPVVTETIYAVDSAENVKPSKYGTVNELAQRALEGALKPRLDSDVVRFMHNRAYDYNYASEIFEPQKDGDKISLFMNAKDRKRNRRTVMKPGRAFKHMFNDVSTARISAITEDWIEFSSPREFTLKEGADREAFFHAYMADRAEYRNPKVTTFRKSLATSCMHGNLVNQDPETDVCPAETYASGDFAVAYLETKDKLLAGRVVYSIKDPNNMTHAPIYGTCEQSLDILTTFLETNNVKKGEQWDDHKLLLIEAEGRIVAPYMDCQIGGEHRNDHIVLKEYGRLCFESTDGFASEGTPCANCGDIHDEEDMVGTDDGSMCTYCFEEQYVCTDDGDILHRDEAVDVCYIGYRGEVCYGTVHSEEATYCEMLNEYWMNNDVVETNNGEWLPEHLMDEYPELFGDENDE